MFLARMSSFLFDRNASSALLDGSLEPYSCRESRAAPAAQPKLDASLGALA